MRPDRAVALVIGAVCIAYAAQALQYPLLPHEQHMDFRPNTMPIGLAVLGVFLSLWVVVAPGDAEGSGGSGLAKDADGWRGFAYRRAAAFVLLMVVYALALRPIGFLLSTALFLFIGAKLLGEKKTALPLGIAALSAAIIWGLVDYALGIHLRPLPFFWTP